MDGVTCVGPSMHYYEEEGRVLSWTLAGGGGSGES
jgi:hypothetical protein